MPNPYMPCGRTTPQTALRLFGGWPAHRAGGLRPSSSPLDTPSRTGLTVPAAETRRWTARARDPSGQFRKSTFLACVASVAPPTTAPPPRGSMKHQQAHFDKGSGGRERGAWKDVMGYPGWVERPYSPWVTKHRALSGRVRRAIVIPYCILHEIHPL
jgi:hypothetical protein